MPGALVRVERSSKLLEEASRMLKEDPYGSPARKRLIDGSGGILQVSIFLKLTTTSIYIHFAYRPHLHSCYASTNQK